MRHSLILPTLLALASCGYGASDTAHQAQINMVGMTAADLQSCAGVPDKTSKIDAHTQIFTYALKNDSTGGIEVTLPIIGGGYTIGGSGSSCTANFRLVDNKVAALFYSGNNDRMVGEDGVCEPIIRGCMRRPQSSMLPVSQQTNASAFSQPPAPPTPVQAAPAAPVVDPDAVVRMPTVGR
ncbi:hypothetical protein RQ831_11360 [Roseomonas gilardii]|uniref:Lipoprotein n=1 Tax=Roseomonas gilardii TaxID=257708 RepID=A0A1L7ACJ5_9PROT|nr:hypothetical protein [Roseomonas gilardii]APT56518.1 hypothetical protein RGI145_04765 [Roseomonas gilardii]MDT8331654.1 hypothetical protein [Roseomonas gilardii]PZR15701.1 MAG: hypothetical protein DI532_05725 [Azospirillum brasilense]